MGSVSIIACALHPSAKEVADLIQKPQKDLRSPIKALALEPKCNQSENPSMRRAIYEAQSDIQLQLREVPPNDANGKAVWAALQPYFPMFALFQSDWPPARTKRGTLNGLPFSLPWFWLWRPRHAADAAPDSRQVDRPWMLLETQKPLGDQLVFRSLGRRPACRSTRPR